VFGYFYRADDIHAVALSPVITRWFSKRTLSECGYCGFYGVGRQKFLPDVREFLPLVQWKVMRFNDKQ